MARKAAPKPKAAPAASVEPEGKLGARRLSANMEDYLEVIYRLSESTGFSRVSTIAEVVGVKKPSVSKAIRRLAREGLVTHTPYGGAAVTPRGMQVAQAQVRSHRAIIRFLEEVLALPSELAEHDACLMEHAISHDTVEHLVRFIDFLDGSGKQLVAQFRESLKAGRGPAAATQKGKRGRETQHRAAGTGRSWTSRV
jgi:DtxR family Mn-dependent transcriptional regulator